MPAVPIPLRVTAGVGAVCMVMVMQAAGQDMIEGKKTEIRRYLPVLPETEIRAPQPARPRPAPQGHASGWLSPTNRSATGNQASTTKIYSAYGDGSGKVKATTGRQPAPRSVQPDAVTSAPAPQPKKSKEPRRTDPRPMPLEITPPNAPTAQLIRPGLVKSPYAPHGLLDVQGLPSGALVKDPVSGKLFRVP